MVKQLQTDDAAQRFESPSTPHYTVSVCIPTYNRPALLEEAIRSSFNQTRPPDEIVVGDDSKNDESSKLVERLARELAVPILYKKNSPGLGQNENINSCFLRARTSHVILLHDDDLLVPNAIEDLLECWSLHPDLTCAYGKQMLVLHNGEELPKRSDSMNRSYRRTPDVAGLQPNAWEVGLSQQIPNCGYMLLTEVAQKTLWRPQSEVGDGGDFDFGFRLGLQGGKFFLVDKITSKYRLTDGSIKDLSTNDAALRSYRQIETTPLPAEAERCRREKLQRSAHVAMGQALGQGDKATAWRIYLSPNTTWRRRLSPGGVKRLAKLFLPVSRLTRA